MKRGQTTQALPADASAHAVAPKEKRGPSPGEPQIQVVVADRFPLMLRGIASLFEAEPGIALVGQAQDADQALALVNELAPDVAVLDLQLPERGGLDVVEALRAARSSTRPVILTSSISHDEFIRARRLGVRGVVLKSMPGHLLVQCVRTVSAGGEFLEKNVSLSALTKLMQRDSTAEDLGAVLTARERRIVDLVATGSSNDAIARRLGVTEGTVKAQLHRIYGKLGLPSRFALTRFARDKGIS